MTDMQIQQATARDLEHALAVERAAFGGDEEAELVRALLMDPSAQPVLSLLAWNGRQAVGHILFTRAIVMNSARDSSAAILAPLAVVPQWQRQGIGGVLIEAGVRRLGDAGVELVFVLGYPDYYTRHGFEPAMPHNLLPHYPVTPAQAWMVRALRPGLLGTLQGKVVCAAAMSDPKYWRE